jgi:hypothetical protein
VAIFVLAAPLAAQKSAPEHWQWALDSAAQHVTLTDSVGAGQFGFVAMAPGWHVTMGPGGFLYDSRYQLEKRFSVESRIFLFPGTPAAEYGVFVGGRGLKTAERRWVAFLLRRDGSAAVVRHEKGVTDSVMRWTKHEAVKGGVEGAANVVQVAVDTVVTFRVNGAAVASFPRAQLNTDGQFGFRMGKGLNLHVTTLDVTQRLAPARE